jgi:hypothetical protein
MRIGNKSRGGFQIVNGVNKFKQDLDNLKAVMQELANYLDNEVLYWPDVQSWFPPDDTGWLLQRLSYMLPEADQVDLEMYVNQFNERTFDRKALLMQKGFRELEASTNQWEQHLSEYWDSAGVEKEY